MVFDQININTLLSIFTVSALGFIATAFWTRRNKRDALAKEKADALAQANKEQAARIADLEQKMAILTSAVTPLSTTLFSLMQATLIKELTHFHTPELDGLLLKAEAGILRKEEEPRFFQLLYDRAYDDDKAIPESERDGAIMLPLVMKRVKAERHLVLSNAIPLPSPQEPDSNK